MMKLSDRLQLIADSIETGETMADIGTDHGFLPLYLIETGISPRVIMCDISGPSLAKAREAFAEADITEGAVFREGNGLEVLEAGEVETVVIAGMGGILMTEIMGSDLKKTVSFHKYILQPRNNAGLLRYWLQNKGFQIEKNLLVREGKFICEVIVVFAPKAVINSDIRPEELSAAQEDPRWELPLGMQSEEAGLAREYAALKIRQEEKKLRGLKKASEPDLEQIRLSESRIRYFNNREQEAGK